MKKQKMCKILLMLVMMVALAVSSFAMVACEPEHTEHTYGEWQIVTEATCTTAGTKEKVCSGCEEGTEGHKVTETIPALGHEWGEGTVTQDATYNTAGVKTFTCAHDNTHTKTEPVAATGIPAMYRGTWICPDMGVEIEVEEDDITMTITSGAVAEITAWDGANGEFEIEFTVTVDDEDEFYVINAEYVAADADADDDYECDVFVCEMLEVGDTEPMNMVFYAEDDLFTVTVNVNDEDFGEVLFYSPYVAPGGFAYVVVAPAEGYEVESVMAGEVELTYVDDAAMYVLTNVTEDVTITVTFAEEAVEPPAPVNIPAAFHATWTKEDASGIIEFTITENGIAAMIWDAVAGGAPANYDATNIAIQGTDLAFTVNGVDYVMFAPEGGTAMVSIAGAMPPVEFTNNAYQPPVSVNIPAAFHGTWIKDGSDVVEITITENAISVHTWDPTNGHQNYTATNITLGHAWDQNGISFTANNVLYEMMAPEANGEVEVLIDTGFPPANFYYDGTYGDVVSIPEGFHGTWTDGTNTLVVTATGVVFNGTEGTDYAPNGDDEYRFKLNGVLYGITVNGNTIRLFNFSNYNEYNLTKEGSEPAVVSIDEAFRGTWVINGQAWRMEITETTITLTDETGTYEATDITPDSDPVDGDGYRFKANGKSYFVADVTETTVWLTINGGTYKQFTKQQGTEPGPGEDEEEFEFSGDQLGTWRGTLSGNPFVVVIEAKKVTINDEEYTEFDEFGRISIDGIGMVAFEFTSATTAWCTYGIEDPIALTKDVPAPVVIAEGYRGTWKIGDSYTMVVTESSITWTTRLGSWEATDIAVSTEEEGYTFVIGEDTYLLYDLSATQCWVRINGSTERNFTKYVEPVVPENFPERYIGIWKGTSEGGTEYTVEFTADNKIIFQGTEAEYEPAGGTWGGYIITVGENEYIFNDPNSFAWMEGGTFLDLPGGYDSVEMYLQTGEEPGPSEPVYIGDAFQGTWVNTRWGLTMVVNITTVTINGDAVTELAETTMGYSFNYADIVYEMTVNEGTLTLKDIDTNETIEFTKQGTDPVDPEQGTIPAAYHGVWAGEIYTFAISAEEAWVTYDNNVYQGTNINVVDTPNYKAVEFVANGIQFYMEIPGADNPWGYAEDESFGGNDNEAEYVYYESEFVRPTIPEPVVIPEEFHATWERTDGNGFYQFTITEEGITALLQVPGSNPQNYTATNIAMQGTDLAFTVNGVNYVMFVPEGGTAMVSIAGAMPPVEFTNYSYVSNNIPEKYRGTWYDETTELVVTETEITLNGVAATDFVDYESEFRFAVNGASYKITVSGNGITLFNFSNYNENNLIKEGAESIEFATELQGTYTGSGEEDVVYTITLTEDAVLFGEDLQEVTDLAYNRKAEYKYSFTFDGTVYSFAIVTDDDQAYIDFIVGDSANPITLNIKEEEVPQAVVLPSSVYGYWVGTVGDVEYTVRVDDTGAYVNGERATACEVVDGGSNMYGSLPDSYNLTVGEKTYTYKFVAAGQVYDKWYSYEYARVNFAVDGESAWIDAVDVKFDDYIKGTYNYTEGEGDNAVSYTLKIASGEDGATQDSVTFTYGVGKNKTEVRYTVLIPRTLIGGESGWLLAGTDFILDIVSVPTEHDGVYAKTVSIKSASKEIDRSYNIELSLADEYHGTWYGTVGEDDVKLYNNMHGLVLVTNEAEYIADVVYCYDYAAGDDTVTSWALKLKPVEGDALWLGLKAIVNGDTTTFEAVDLEDSTKKYTFTRSEGITTLDAAVIGTWENESNSLIITSDAVSLDGAAATYVTLSGENIYTMIVDGVEYTFTLAINEEVPSITITDVYKEQSYELASIVVFSADYIGTWRDAANNKDVVITERGVTYDGVVASSIDWDRDNSTAEVTYYTFTITIGEGEEAVSTTYKISGLEVSEDVAYFDGEELTVKSGSFDLTVGEEEAVEFFYQHFASNTATNKPNTAIVNTYASGAYKYFQGVYVYNGITLIAMPKEVFVVMDGAYHRANAINYLGDDVTDDYGFASSYANVTGYEFYINNRSVRVELILGCKSSTDNGALISLYDAKTGTQIDQTVQLNRYVNTDARDEAFIGSFYTDAIVTGDGESASSTFYTFSVYNSNTTAGKVTYTTNVLQNTDGKVTNNTMNLPHPIYGENNEIIGYGFFKSSTDYKTHYTIIRDGEGQFTLTLPTGESHSVTKFAGFDEKYYGTWLGFKQGSNNYNLIIDENGASLLRTSNNAKYFVYAVAPRAEGGYWFMNSVMSSYGDNYICINEDGSADARFGNADYKGDNALVKHVPLVLDAKFQGSWSGTDSKGNAVTVTVGTSTIDVTFTAWAYPNKEVTANLTEFSLDVNGNTITTTVVTQYYWSFEFIYDDAAASFSINIKCSLGTANPASDLITLTKAA